MHDKIFALLNLMDKVAEQIGAIGETGEDELDSGMEVLKDAVILTKPMVEMGYHTLRSATVECGDGILHLGKG